MQKLCVGLFGTCGNSTWRNDFIEIYNHEGIAYFNPQVEDWDPSLAEIEAAHLAEDAVILFPVLAETYGLGSCAEVGFSILNAIKLDNLRDFVLLIDGKLDEELMQDKAMAKESLRARALIKQHLKKLALSNVYLVDSLDEMLEVSVQLYTAAKYRVALQKYNLHVRGANS